MSSTVLLVDADQEVRAIIERQIDPARATLVHVNDAEQAQKVVKERAPSLIVVNVDIAKGWPLCTALKRSHATIPVIVVSFRLGKEVFNNHQKLDTRADAYHRLPEELEGLEISLGYFSSHRSEVDEQEVSQSRPRPRRIDSGVSVPKGVAQRLEATVAEQARALEDARRQIEALEAERDAVADKNRRQMLELMTVSPAGQEGQVEVAALRERVSSLQAEVLLSSRRDDELRELRSALAAANASLLSRHADNDRLAYDRAALEVSFKQALLELDETKNASERGRQLLEAQVLSLRAEKAQIVQRLTELEESARAARIGGGIASEALEAAREAARKEAAGSAEQLAHASVQLGKLTAEVTQAHEARMHAEKDKNAALEKMAQAEQRMREVEARAESAESAWSGVNARLEQAQALLQGKAQEMEQVVVDKRSVEQALATSRKLMREYAADAARKAEELKAASERVKELETRAATDAGAKDELATSLVFEKSLVESLESEVAALKGRVTTPEERLAQNAERDALASHAAMVRGRFEALVVYVRALEARLATAEAVRGQLAAKLEALSNELRVEMPALPVSAPAMELPSAPNETPTAPHLAAELARTSGPP